MPEWKQIEMSCSVSSTAVYNYLSSRPVWSGLVPVAWKVNSWGVRLFRHGSRIREELLCGSLQHSALRCLSPEASSGQGKPLTAQHDVSWLLSNRSPPNLWLRRHLLFHHFCGSWIQGQLSCVLWVWVSPKATVIWRIRFVAHSRDG